MGDMADDIADAFDYWGEEQYDYEYRRKKRNRKNFQPPDPYTWKDGNDVVHNMHDMEVGHIRNTIRFLESMGTYPNKLEELREVLFEKTREGPPTPTRKYPNQKSNLFKNNDDLDDEIPF